MKKIYLSIFTTILTIGVIAQSLTVSESSFALESSDKLLYGDLLVTNVTEGELTVRVRQEAILTVADEELQICWGGLCFEWQAGDHLYLVPAIIGAGEEYDGFALEYKANSATSGSVWKVCFYVVGNSDDEVCIDVTYGTVSVSEIDVPVASLGKAWPNPSVDIVNIPYVTYTGGNEILVRNLMGQNVLRQELQAGEGIVGLNVSGLDQGLYFYSLISGGEIVSTGRFSVGR